MNPYPPKTLPHDWWEFYDLLRQLGRETPFYRLAAWLTRTR